MIAVIAARPPCRIVGGIIACVLLLTCLAPAQARTIDAADLRRIITPSQPQVSPDGSRVVFIKSVQDFAKDRIDSQLVLLNVRTGAQRPLTYDREGLDSPRWSPSGDRIAFIANAGSGPGAQSQIFIMPMSGGDAHQVTKAPNGVDEFTWKPDGTALAYVTRDTPPNKAALDAHRDAFDVGDEDLKMREAPVPSHVWIAAADGSGNRRLTSGSWSLSSMDGGIIWPLSWSADGKRIAITKLPNAVYGDSDDEDVAMVDATSGRMTDVAGQRKYVQGALFAPVGGSYAAAWYRHGGFNSSGSLLFMGASGPGREIAPTFDRNIVGYLWEPGGKRLIVAAESGPKTGLWEQPLQGAARPLDLGDLGVVGDMDVGKNGAITFIGSSPQHPVELYFMSSARAPIRRLTHFNDAISRLSLGATSELRWKGPNGFTEDGIVTTPPAFSRAKRYPLVLLVHGGPQSASQLSFNDLAQLLAARGFVVFRPNYRGSTNLGDAYQHAIYRDAGDGPGKDVMAGVAALERLGFIDTRRMAVSGWSYGGYMTTWLESHYDVWKAAMAGAAVVDYVADYTISWYQKGDAADFFGTTPWTSAGWQIWRAQSPITYARNVRAPTLIMGDVGDANVPLYNSYLWYHALRDNGVEVRFIAFPRNSHYPDDPVGNEAVERYWVDWMVDHLR